MIPAFEEKVIERRERTQIVQDWKGNICEISNEYSLEYLRHAIDFVTRRWIKCPVETPADWADMRRRYDPDDPARLPADPVAAGEAVRNRDYPLTMSFSGPFWQVREWMGFENTCMALVDKPAFVHEMIEFWQEYVATLMKKAFQYYIPDEVHISEDMAYKGFSMISPAMCREFLMPTWKRWGEIARGAGVRIYAVDSDGFIGELIPLWIESGLNACDPVEVAAGNDIVEFSRRFGKNMAYRGGIDKRCIAEGGAAIENEIKRIMPVIKAGGYIPGCDHGVPNDVSWPNFVYYTKLLARATGWL
jgi:uroporphyrinogen decarboxylase